MNTLEPLDELYFRWLYAQVGNIRSTNPGRTHWKFAKQLYEKEFVWFIPNDDNRVEDGRYLRHEFLHDAYIKDPDPVWMDLGCSMLEMLVALSRRLAFLTDGDPRDWFWQMIENIGLGFTFLTDKNYDDQIRDGVDATLDRVIFRTYSENGVGSLFPLPESTEDQRKTEIWHQLNAYILNTL